MRGPQFEAAWCDELAKWRYAEATFDMLQFALRLGKRPRQLITTVALGERLDGTGFVLADASGDVIADADIERAR